jgi:endonuclease/exonuclease/phosphatase family metal-dependent hydrolase
MSCTAVGVPKCGRGTGLRSTHRTAVAVPGARGTPILTIATIALAVGAMACASMPRGDRAISLTVMTYNIRSGNGNLAGTAAAIRGQAPDVVGLQEVDVHWAERSAFVDQATELGRLLGMNVRFARIYSLPGPTPSAEPREFGVALLTRYPISAFANDSITRLSTQEENPIPALMPGLLDATLDLDGTRVRVLDTHLDYRKDPTVRERQVHEILARLGALATPTILLGDLNAPPSAPELQPLRERLHDAWSDSADPGFTYPGEQPAERIDYVLVSPQFSVTSVRVPATEASDHRPVVARLELQRRSTY